MIEARDVRVTRGGVSVLAGASCAVRPGELVMLVGGNGAGKSTLARLLCASDLAEPGMVRVDDEDSCSWSACPPPRTEPRGVRGAGSGRSDRLHAGFR